MNWLELGISAVIGGVVAAIIAAFLIIFFYNSDSTVVTTSISDGAIVAFGNTKNCPDGWTEFDQANGRMIVGAGNGSGNKDGNGKALSSYTPNQTGGQETTTLTASNLPAHSHRYYDIYYSERGGSVSVPNNKGSNGSDSDNKGYQITRTTLADSSKAGGFTNLPPYIALLYCEKS
ncbi:MAG: hypothetical protein NXI13_14085 [Proteobacteria bacterium]|nr:hypothetical protein [Pseudomonadota bacterium]